MNIDRKVIEQALEALKNTHYRIIDAGLLDQKLLDKNFTAAEALREALAQQQPVQQSQPMSDEQIYDGWCYAPADNLDDFTAGVRFAESITKGTT